VGEKAGPFEHPEAIQVPTPFYLDSLVPLIGFPIRPTRQTKQTKQTKSTKQTILPVSLTTAQTSPTVFALTPYASRFIFHVPRKSG
jgi:hypothetical protein